MAIPFVKDPNSPKIYDSRTGEWIPNEQEFFKRAKEAGLPSTKFQQGVNFRIGTAEQISKFTQAKPVSAPPYSVKTPLSARAPTQTSKKPFVPTAINTPAPVPTSRTQSTIIPSPKNYGNYDINTPFGITGGIRGSQNERSSDREGNLTQSAKEQLARIFPTEEKARQAFKSAQGSDNEFEFYWNQFKDLVSAPQTQTTQVPVSTPARAQTSQTPQTAQSSIPFVKDPNSPKIYDSRTGEWIPNEQEFFKRAKEAGLPSSKFQEGVNYRTGTGNEVSQIIAPYTGAQTRDMDILLNTPANQRTMNENALVAEYERGQSQTILTPKQLNESFAQLLNELITQATVSTPTPLQTPQTQQTAQTAQSTIPFVKDPNSPKIYDSRTGEWIPNEQEFFKRAKEAGLPSSKFQEGVNYRTGTGNEVSQIIAPYTGAQTRDMDILLNTPANQRTMNENALVAEYERGQSQTILTPKQLNESFAQLLNELITQDPFLSEQLKDPKTKAMFDALPDELKSTYLNVARTTAETIKKGKMVNPKIEITPEQAAKFLTQAHTELDPYYQEQIGFIQKDLDISFQRLQEDYEKKYPNLFV